MEKVKYETRLNGINEKPHSKCVKVNKFRLNKIKIKRKRKRKQQIVGNVQQRKLRSEKQFEIKSYQQQQQRETTHNSSTVYENFFLTFVFFFRSRFGIGVVFISFKLRH